MSIYKVNYEIANFLRRKDPEVLCIRGRWGVGKTHIWQHLQKEASSSREIALKKYSYVSLFGINSINELKFTIFENTLGKEFFHGIIDNIELIRNYNVWRRLGRIFQSFPIVNSYIGSDAVKMFFFSTIKNQIICIDDLERRGQELTVQDVLGLISFLRERRDCKVALILNDEALKNNDKQEFEANLEKVVDISLRFEPTSSESIEVALNSKDFISSKTAEFCRLLDISNIRVIKKIDYNIRQVKLLVDEFDDNVFDEVSKSVALFTWSKFQSNVAPSLEFLRKMAGFSFSNEKHVSDKEAAWNALLRDYGYGGTDEFDLELIKGVENGYFDSEYVKKHASQRHKKIQAEKAYGSFRNAWDTYHDSFSDNEQEVIDTIQNSFCKNVKFISPLDLNGTVSLFKNLGRYEQAVEIVQYYVKERDQEHDLFNLEGYPFRDMITEPEVKEIFKKKYKDTKSRRDIPGMLFMLKDNWDDNILSELATTPIDAYRQAFKKATGEDLQKMLDGSLQFLRVVNATQEMKKVSENAKEALKLIGAESHLNALRVKKFGVIVKEASAVSVTEPAETSEANS